MKKYVFPGFIFVAVVVLVLVYITGIQGPEVKPITREALPTQEPLPSLYRGLDLQTSFEDDVVQALGAPLRTSTYSGVTTHIFATDQVNRNTSVEINQNNSIRRIIEPLKPSERFSALSSGLGTPDLELYGKHEGLGFRLYVYISSGVALLANPETQEVRERWYYQKMGAALFKQSLGEGFSETYNPNKQ